MKTLSNYNFSLTSIFQKKFVAFFFFISLSVNIYSQCDTVLAYTGTIDAGFQNYQENLGMAFTVNQSIKVTALGAFDSGQDGLNAPITVGIFNRLGNVLVAGPIVLSGSTDPLVGRHRMRSVSPTVLAPGRYMVVALGYGPAEANGNTNLANLPTSLNTNGGQVTFDSCYFGGAVFGVPPALFPVPDGFHAGTFQYTIDDVTPPSIDCITDVTINTSGGVDALTGDCGAVVDNISLAGSSDNCGIDSIKYVLSGVTSGSGLNDASGLFFNVGITLITYTVTDLSGNSAACSMQVIVIDDEVPVITCPMNIVVDNTLDSCNAPINYLVNFSDNCMGLMIDGFTNEFAPANWVLSNSNGGDGTVLSGAPNDILIVSSDNGAGGSNNTDYCITIPGTYGGVMSFDWSYEIFSIGPFQDQFHYVVNGTATPVVFAGAPYQTGSILLSLNANDEFCFRMFSVDQILGSAITISMNFMFDEDINPLLAQTAGLPSGSLFPVGTVTNTFVVTDNNDNTASCSFTVTVNDVQNPTIQCPLDIEVELDPLECEEIVMFDAIVDDNCPGVTYEVSSSLESGDLFPIGVTTVTYIATDASNNTATCSFDVTIIDYFNSSLGCLNRNISLDQNCQAIADPTLLLTGFISPIGDTLLGCLDSFHINFIAPNGTLLGNILDGTYLGKTLNYTIVNDLHGFNCWGTVKVEDKLRPNVFCTNDTLSCVAPLDSAIKPSIRDNCDGSKLVLVSSIPTNLNCDAQFLSKITKIWTAIDAYGNQGDTCTQEIYIKRTNTANIVWPKNITLTCTSFTTQYPPLSLTGMPTLDGFPLHPLNQTVICNGFSAYTDVDVVSTDCKRIIQRTWEIGEWWCNSTNIQKWVQMIAVKDTTAPVIKPIADVTVSTTSGGCKATFNLPFADIKDNCNTFTLTINTGEGVVNVNGGKATLSAGEHTLTYLVTDKCGNYSTATSKVTVSDKIEPIAVCETRTVVSLKDDGTAWLHKSSVDDGSFDECGPVKLEIRRMNTTCDTLGIKWSDEVAFCCADLGKDNMVILQVTDMGGKTNQCMVSVEVQDKRQVYMTCPPHVTVSCTTAYDPTNASGLDGLFGAAKLTGGGCANSSNVTQVLSGDLNNCFVGTLTRTFTLRQGGLVTGTCQQLITFQPTTPFNLSMIRYPKDSIFTNTRCTPLDLSPETLPVGYGKPIITGEGVCDQLGTSYEDDVYSFNGNGACYKIVRHWTVINWCHKVNGKIWTDSFDQVLVVMNTVDPVITSSTAKREICSYNADCTPVPIKLDASATDDCTPVSQLKWRWEVTLKNGLKITGTGRDVIGTYPFGTHRVDFEVEDLCGNIAYTGYNFEVKSCKPPSAYCKQGLSTSLIGMDTDNNGTIDAEMSILKPKFFDNGSSQSCGNSFKLSFSANVSDTTLTVSCAQKNKSVPVQLWVTDQNGNTSFCSTFVMVRDSNNVNICPATSPIDGEIKGNVLTTDGRPVKDVVVSLVQASEEKLALTDNEGKYNFGIQQLDLDYTVTPKKADDPLNGVSTLDMVLIQRHILGMAKLTDPYKLLAADINKDGKLTAADLVKLRKVILGVDPNMPYDESWRFVWEGQQFADQNNPFTSQLMSIYDIIKLDKDMNINFNAMKVGDVNGSVVTNLNDVDTEYRSGSDLELYFEDREVKEGSTYTVSLSSEHIVKLQGLQTTLEFDGLTLKSTSGEDVSNNNIHKVEDGTYSFSMHTNGGRTIRDGEAIVAFEVIATRDGVLSEMIVMSDRILKTEAYLGEEAGIGSVTMRSKVQEEAVKFAIGQNKPNPWQIITTVPVTMPEKGAFSYRILDQTGRVIVTRSLVMDKGLQKVELNKNTLNLTTGSYIFEGEYNNETKAIQMIRID